MKNVKIFAVIAAISASALLSACTTYVTPEHTTVVRPAPHRLHPWVPGHYNRFGGWVPGHYR